MKRTNNFMDKPEEGWSHNTAALATGNGVYYSYPVKYVGSIQMVNSLRDLDMKTKTDVCWEAIARCVDAAGLRKKTKRKPSKVVKSFLAETPYIKLMELKLNLSTQGMATSDMDTNEVISNDDIKKVSFAAGGEKSDYDFITYVAKDKRDNRYCHVFDCGILADDVLATVGQIFSILTGSAVDDLDVDKHKFAEAAGKVDNPLYAALAGAVRPGATAMENAGYDEQAPGEAQYDDPSESGAGVESNYAMASEALVHNEGAKFAEFLNENVASAPIYGETDEGDVYGDGAAPGWGYLDVKPDEDLYGGLADVFVDE